VLEIDDDRRRLSLSIKRVEGQVLPARTPAGDAAQDGESGEPGQGPAGDLDNVPELGLSEDVFADEAAQQQPPADLGDGADSGEAEPAADGGSEPAER
jgi:small subunit ribosomal protein S1